MVADRGAASRRSTAAASSRSTGSTSRCPTGGVTVLVGPSGSGKSTVLRCINGLELPTAGTVHVDGRLLTPKSSDLDAIREEVGMVFQQFNLFAHLTALENITLAQRVVRKRTKAVAESTAREQLARVGIPEKADSYPRELSGGQQQRVAIARSLAMDPKLMLFDEPTSALDPEMINEVLDVMLGARPGRDDDGGGHPRDGLRPGRGRLARGDGPRPHRRAGPAGRGVRRPAGGANPAIPREGAAPLTRNPWHAAAPSWYKRVASCPDPARR